MTLLVVSSTLAAGPWTANGRTSPEACLESIQAADSDLTYISCVAAGQGTTGRFQLASGSDGTGYTHQVSIRARPSGGVGTTAPRLLVELYETATLRGSMEFTLPKPPIRALDPVPIGFVPELVVTSAGANYVTYTFQAYDVTAWSDLRLHITPTRITGNQKIRVTAAQLEYVADVPATSARGRLVSPGVALGRLATAGVKRGVLPHC